MTPQARLDAAVRGVLGPALRDFAKGAIAREDLEETARRRANAIRANFHASRASAQAEYCRSCTACAATTVVAGLPCCDGCAPALRKAVPARRRA
jgi:hypothetical protein